MSDSCTLGGKAFSVRRISGETRHSFEPQSVAESRKLLNIYESYFNRPNPIIEEELTPEGYANAVLAYSMLPSGAGQNHERLARFLAPSLFAPANGGSSVSKKCFLSTNSLGSIRPKVRKHHSKDQDMSAQKLADGPIHFMNCRHFADFNPWETQDGQNQLLFLRGYPSGEWLRLIGSKYHVDPEFFSRHMDFGLTEDRLNNFSLPPLPSSSWHLMRLHIMTIGFRDTLARKYRQDDIDSLRRDGNNQMENYNHQLTLGSNFEVGDSIVRNYSTLDETHFSIEQRVSVCLQNMGHRWASESSVG